MPGDVVSLQARGQVFEGWLSASINRTIEGPASSFSVAVSEKHPSRPAARQLRPGDDVTVRLGGDVVVAGFIDRVQHELGAGSHQVTVTGRDRTADLVDCAPDLPPNEWRDVDLLRLAKILAAPFGITVAAETGAGAAFPKVALNPGETAWGLLEERARYRAGLLIADGAGGLVLTLPGAGRGDALELGRNVLEATLSLTDTERFSDYVVKGQMAGTDWAHGDVAASPEGRAEDRGVARFRPLVIVASSGVDTSRCLQRARFEASVRAGRAERVGVLVQGWRQSSGALWQPNLLVHALLPRLGVDADLIVATVEFRIDGSTRTSHLELVRRESFAVEPEPIEASGFGYGD